MTQHKAQVTAVKNKSHLEFMRVRTAQIKGRKSSLYANDKIKISRPTKIDLSVNELYELSQVTKEEA